VRRGRLSASHLPAEAGAVEVRLAFAIPRRVGGAVVRNRLRRRLRATCAEVHRHGPGLPAGALLIAAGPDAVGTTSEELRNDVIRLVDALASRTGTTR